jgi:hypothetical protein
MASEPKFHMGDKVLHVGEAVDLVTDSIWEPATQMRYYVTINANQELELLEESALKKWEPTRLLVEVPAEVLKDWDDLSDTAVLDEYLLSAIRAWKLDNEA